MIRFSADSEPDEIRGTAEVLVRALAGPLAVSTNNRFNSVNNTQHLHRTVPLLLVVAFVRGHLKLSIILYHSLSFSICYLSSLMFSLSHVISSPAQGLKPNNLPWCEAVSVGLWLPSPRLCPSVLAGNFGFSAFALQHQCPVSAPSCLSSAQRTRALRCCRGTASKQEKNRNE